MCSGVGMHAAALALCLLGSGACALWRPEVRAARRAEEKVERVAPPPAVDPGPAAAAARSRATPESGSSSPTASTRALAPRPAPELGQERPLIAAAGRGDGVAREVVWVVNDLLFAPGATELDAQAHRRLEQLIGHLRLVGGAYRLEVQGHSDASGSEATNLRLALRRAEAVREHLVRELGLPAQIVSIVAVGPHHPIADNATPSGRARNRRVAVLVLR
jgi:outer membrane protein OmpA-like peptidoglycan-associated protein